MPSDPRANAHLTAVDLAAYLNKSERTIRRWRADGIGPPWHKYESGYVYYLWPEVKRWQRGRHGRSPRRAT